MSGEGKGAAPRTESRERGDGCLTVQRVGQTFICGQRRMRKGGGKEIEGRKKRVDEKRSTRSKHIYG